jgi:hypothetical protein
MDVAGHKEDADDKMQISYPVYVPPFSFDSLNTKQRDLCMEFGRPRICGRPIFTTPADKSLMRECPDDMDVEDMACCFTFGEFCNGQLRDGICRICHVLLNEL